jgi:hypothetical protein
MLFGLAFLGVGKARVRRGIARTNRLVVAGLDLCSSPPGLTRWSMPNGRVQFGPTSVLRSSMDRRGICRQDGASRLVPGDDEERGSSPVVTKREGRP